MNLIGFDWIWLYLADSNDLNEEDAAWGWGIRGSTLGFWFIDEILLYFRPYSS